MEGVGGVLPELVAEPFLSASRLRLKELQALFEARLALDKVLLLAAEGGDFGLGPFEIAAQSGQVPVPRRHPAALVSQLAPEPIRLCEVGRETLAVGALPLGIGLPLAWSAASLLRLLGDDRSAGGRNLGLIDHSQRVVTIGTDEGERNLCRVRLSGHLGTINGRDKKHVHTKGDFL